MSGHQPGQTLPGRRIRVRYAVGGKVRFLSHRDVARVIERAIRRAGVPVAYSEGFSPRPKVQYGLALSTGYESDGEYIDINLDPEREGVTQPEEMALALTASLPPGLEVMAAAEVDPGEGSLQDSVVSTGWRMWVAATGRPSVGELAQRVDDLLAAESFEIDIIRKGKPVREDLRPLVHELTLVGVDGSAAADATAGGTAVMTAELGTRPRSIRPSELLGALGVSEPLKVRRTHQWTRRDGSRGEPLGLSGPAPRAEVCAS